MSQTVVDEVVELLAILQKQTTPVLALRHHRAASFINTHFKRMILTTCIYSSIPKGKASVHYFLTS